MRSLKAKLESFSQVSKESDMHTLGEMSCNLPHMCDLCQFLLVIYSTSKCTWGTQVPGTVLDAAY